MNVPATLLLAIPRNSRITRTHSFPFHSFWKCVRCDVVRCGVFGCIAWRLFPILWTHYRLKTANKFNGNVNAWKLVCHFRDRRKMPSILVASIRNLIWQAPCAHNDTKENTTDDLLVVQERATWGLRPKKQSNSIPLFDTQDALPRAVCVRAHSCLRIQTHSGAHRCCRRRRRFPFSRTKVTT